MLPILLNISNITNIAHYYQYYQYYQYYPILPNITDITTAANCKLQTEQIAPGCYSVLPIFLSISNIINSIFMNNTQYYISSITQYLVVFNINITQYYQYYSSLLTQYQSKLQTLKTVFFQFNPCQCSSILQAISNTQQYFSV